MSSQRTVRMAWFLLNLLVVGLGGCAGAPSATPVAASTGSMPRRVEARNLLSLVPSDVSGVVRLDIRALFEVAWMRELLLTTAARHVASPAVFQNFLERTDEIVIGMGEVAEGASEPPSVVLFRGRYSAADIESQHPGDVPSAYRGHALLARVQAGTVSLLLDDHTAIWGATHMVHAALDVVDGRVPTRGFQSDMVRLAAERVGLTDHTFTVVMGMRALLPPQGNPIADGPQLLAFWTDVGDSVDVRAFVTFSDPSIIPFYMTAFDTVMTQLPTTSRVADLGLAGVLERLVVNAEDGEVRAQVTLASDETARLMRVLETLLDETN